MKLIIILIAVTFAKMDCDTATCQKVNAFLKTQDNSDCFGKYVENSIDENECYCCKESNFRRLINLAVDRSP